MNKSSSIPQSDDSWKSAEISLTLFLEGEAHMTFDLPREVLEGAARFVSTLHNSGLLAIPESILGYLSLFAESEKKMSSQDTSFCSDFSLRESSVSHMIDKNVGSLDTSTVYSDFSLRESSVSCMSEDVHNEDVQSEYAQSKELESEEEQSQQSEEAKGGQAQCKNDQQDEQPCHDQVKMKRERFRSRGPVISEKVPITKANEKEATKTLMLAVLQDDETSAQTALYDGANMDWFSRQTMLHMAAERGHVKVMRVLLDEGADLEAEDAEGRTALQVAAYYGRDQSVDLLINAKAKIDAKTNSKSRSDKGGWTALHYAAYAGHLESARVLVMSGGNVNAISDSCKTPLNIAHDRVKTEVEKFLRSQGGKKYKKLLQTKKKFL